jgi:gluconolactonase
MDALSSDHLLRHNTNDVGLRGRRDSVRTMRSAPASLRLALVFSVSTFALAGCAGGGGGGASGGQSGTGSGGKGGSSSSGGSTGSGGNASGGSSGSGGSVTGSGGNASGGATGTGGSATGGATGSGGATGGATGSGGNPSGGNTGTGGSATGGATGTGGSAGATGAGGQAGGSGGAAGSGSGFTPYACPSGVTSPAASAIPAGSTATRISGAPPMDNFDGSNGTSFTNVEGPVWISNALYFSEMTGGNNPPPSRILKIDSSDVVSPFYPSGGGGDSGSNGMAVDAKGNLVTANHGVGGIVSFTIPGATKTTLISSYNGSRFNSPNDITIRSDGTIYFTDPNFQAPQPGGKYPQTTTGVYMVPPGSSTAMEIISNMSNPNGIALSLDEKTLYVGSGSGVSGYAVNADGTIGATAADIDGTNLDHQNTDGMAIDCAGDLYVVRVNTKDIDVISFGSTHPSPTSTGTHLTTITGVPGNGQLTNLAFGGSDHKTLYITAQGNAPAKGVFKLVMPVPGMPY